VLFPVFLTDQRVYSDIRDRFFVMGRLRIVDRDWTFAWPGRFGYRGLEALHERGYQAVLIPDEVMRLRGRGRFETCPYGYQNGNCLEKVRFFGKSSG